MLECRIGRHPADDGRSIVEIVQHGAVIAQIFPEMRSIKVVSEILGEIDFDRLHPPCLTIHFEDHGRCH